VVIRSRSIFAGQPLLDDLEVEEAEEAAAEAEAERREVSISKLKLASLRRSLESESAQLLEIGGVDREEAAEDHRLDGLKPGSGRRRAAVVGDGVADAGLGDVLDLRGDEADLAGAELAELLDLGAEHADPVDQMAGAGGHEADLLALADDAVDHPDQDDDAEIGVVPAVDQHRLQRRVGSPLGGGMRATIASSTSSMPWPVLAEHRPPIFPMASAGRGR
jgi:hypothetical protein